MRRNIGLGLLFLVSTVVWGTLPAHGAAPLSSVIHLDAEGLTDAEYRSVYQGLVDALAFQRNKTAWACVEDPDALLTSLAPAVHIDVRITQDPSPDAQVGDVAVLVELQVRGQGIDGRLRSIPAARLDPDDRGPTLSGEARAALAELLDTFSPCKAKARLKGKMTMRVPELAEITYLLEQSELTLTLRQDGSFEAGTPLVWHGEGRYLLADDCAGKGRTTVSGMLRLTGEHSDDGRLVVRQLQIVDLMQQTQADFDCDSCQFLGSVQGSTATGTAVCPDGGASVSAAVPPLPVVDLLGTDEVTIELADRSIVALPQPAALGPFVEDWELTLTLEYVRDDGGEATAVAFAPPASR